MPKKLPEYTELFFTPTGFGVKRISRETIHKNLGVLRQIAKEAREYLQSTKDSITKIK